MTLDKIRERRDAIASKGSVEEALNYAVSFAADTSEDGSSDILDGVIIGKNSMDTNYYSEVIEYAFNMNAGEFSPVISLTTAKNIEHWVICKREKTSEFFEENYEKIEDSYVSEKIGEILSNVKKSIGDTVKETSTFENLDYSAITMG